MKWSDGLSWWAALKNRHAPVARDTDCADMGTAFGLDASFGKTAAAESSAHAGPATRPATPWANRVDRRNGL